MRPNPPSPKEMKSLIRWRTAWNRASDKERGKFRAQAVRKLIELWELIRRQRREWRCITTLAPNDSRRRWVRRNLYTLQLAGLIEVTQRERATYFRRKKK